MNRTLKALYDTSPIPVQELFLTAFSRHQARQRYGGRFKEFRCLLRDSEWWCRSRMQAWQDERLRAVIKYADENVPYYRELFIRHGIRASTFRGLEDLTKIPVLTKATVKTRLRDLISTRFHRRSLNEGHTSGTTGAPLSMFYDGDMMAMTYAALDRQYRWARTNFGQDGDRVATIRGNIIVPLNQSRAPFWRWNATHNQLFLSSFHLTEQNLGSYFDALRSYEVTLLDGYPSTVYVLAKILLKKGQVLPLRAVLTSSETLYDFQRSVIEKAFQCEVFDYYGAAERVIFSVECEHHMGHHLCEEYGVTEILDENFLPARSGQEGRLAGTTLHNTGMPLIRYLTDDRSAIRTDPCNCGRALPLMNDVTTKAEDFLRLSDGRLISPSALTHPFKPLDSIEESQLIQTSLNKLTVRLVPRPEYRPEHGARLIKDLRARLVDDMDIQIELVDTLPRTAAGKFRWVISSVDPGL